MLALIAAFLVLADDTPAPDAFHHLALDTVYVAGADGTVCDAPDQRLQLKITGELVQDEAGQADLRRGYITVRAPGAAPVLYADGSHWLFWGEDGPGGASHEVYIVRVICEGIMCLGGGHGALRLRAWPDGAISLLELRWNPRSRAEAFHHPRRARRETVYAGAETGPIAMTPCPGLVLDVD